MHTILTFYLALAFYPPDSSSTAWLSSFCVSTARPFIKVKMLQERRVCWARYVDGGRRPSNSVLEEKAFRVPCPEQLTIELLSSLQRALKVRGYYDGSITGYVDAETQRAVQEFQRDRGFDSPILTLETVTELGLLPIPNL